MFKLIAIFLTLMNGTVFGGKPSKEQTQTPEQRQYQEATEEAKQYRAEVTELAKDIARERAEKLAWLYFPSEVNWIGVGLYYGNGWQLRQPCDKDRQCIPHMDVLYGAEVFLNPFASLDVVGRIGGAAQVADVLGTRHGLDASILLRWRVVGVVPLALGWRIVGTPYQQITDESTISDTVAYTQFAHLEGGFRFRGATASIGLDLGLHKVLAVKSTQDAVSVFSGIVSLKLTTPAILGF